MIRLADHLSMSEFIYDNVMPDFERIVGWSRTILRHPRSELHFRAGSFCFETGLIAHPTTTYRCWDPSLRRQAIKLLNQKPWREKYRINNLAVDVSLLIAKFEEERALGG